MRYLIFLALLGLTGCCGMPQEISSRQDNLAAMSADSLYQFRLELSGQTKISGLLALKQQGPGIWGGLLDATGVPLVKLKVTPDGNSEIEYCATPVCDTRLPEVLGKLIGSIYFTSANKECPWYTVSCICEQPEDGTMIKWKKFGPFRSWEMKHGKPGAPDENIIMKMYFSSVLVQLQKIVNPIHD